MPFYSGRVEFNHPKIDRWIREHRSFASRDWLRSQVIFGKWIYERGRRGRFHILAEVGEGRKTIKVLIRCIHYPNGNPNYPYNHVYVEHAHVRYR